MSRRYTYARTIETQRGKETFSAVEFDSFDEAMNAVEKGVRDRYAQFPAGLMGVAPVPLNDTTPHMNTGEQTKTPGMTPTGTDVK